MKVLSGLAGTLLLLLLRPGIRRKLLATRVPLRLIRGNDLEPADLDPRFLEAADHLGQRLLDIPPHLPATDLQHGTDLLALLLEPHDHSPQLRRIQPNEDLPVAATHRSMHGVKDLLANALGRCPNDGCVEAHRVLSLPCDSGRGIDRLDSR